MFFHRERELREIGNLLEGSGHAILLYGKRRVGKTRLIQEAFKNRRTIYFECQIDTLDHNLLPFTDQIARSGLPLPSYVSFRSFVDAFEYLNSLGERIDIAIDEYPYLKKMNDGALVDSLFQKIIDNHLGNLNLIISGSQMKVMEELLYEGNPLRGRFALSILLEELNYLEASSFYADKPIYEKAAFYSVFGGSPFVNRSIDASADLRSNVIATFLKEGSEIHNYAGHTCVSDVAATLQAQRILSFIGNGRKRYKDMVAYLDKDKTGLINKSLNSLVELGLVSKRCPINKSGDNKKIRYEIEDNALRFYYTYVYNHGSELTLLGAENYYDQYIAPTINEFISLRFEKQVRDYFSLLSRRGKLKDIRNIGTYYYDDPGSKNNGVFDVALERKDGYSLYEVKYLKGELSKQAMLKEAEQIAKIKEIKINNIGFVSVSGFKEIDVPFDLIDGKDLYEVGAMGQRKGN